MAEGSETDNDQPAILARASDPPLRMLVVGAGPSPDWLEAISPPERTIAFAAYADVTTLMLRQTRPDLVLSTLIGNAFDAIDLASKLVEARFSGRYRAIALGPIRADLIRSEVISAAPALDFDIYQMEGP